jgi:hypothetical protein
LTLLRIDLSDCACVDCDSGAAVPLNGAEPEQLVAAVEGKLVNASGQRIYAAPDLYVESATSALDLLADALDGESHRAVLELARRYRVALDDRKDEVACRAELIASDAGRELFAALVECEGRREDTLAMKMLALTLSFPTLKQAVEEAALDLTAGWSARELERWATYCASDGGRHAASFVLQVWSPGRWACGPFNVHEALAVWDDGHREAFLAWARRPWWA